MKKKSQNVWEQNSITKCKFKVCNQKNISIISFQPKGRSMLLFIFLIIKWQHSNIFWLWFIWNNVSRFLKCTFTNFQMIFFWKQIYFLQDYFTNKAHPLAKINSWVCWWIWMFLSNLWKFHVWDFLAFGTLCICYWKFSDSSLNQNDEPNS